MNRENKEKLQEQYIWPKSRPVLTKEQQKVFSEWYQYWLSKEGMQGRYSFIDRFGHEYAVKTFEKNCTTLDIGAGNGAHLGYEDLDSQEYTAFELSGELIEIIKKDYPKAKAIIGDCQKEMDFRNNYFDRVLAIHVLEHLDNLPVTLNEVHRILRPNGKFSVVIPCESGMLYNFGKKFSSERMFKKKFHQNYDWLIKYDHINTAYEVIRELKDLFSIVSTQYFPFLIPSINLELVIGITCTPRK
jgi:SAM-dependent methyltransferase